MDVLLINTRHPAEQLLNRNAFLFGRLRRLPSGNALIHLHASASSAAPLGLGSRSRTTPDALLLSSQCSTLLVYAWEPVVMWSALYRFRKKRSSWERLQ